MGVLTLKSPHEIEHIRAAGRVVVEAHRLARGLLAPGVRTREIDDGVEDLLARRGAVSLFRGIGGPVPYPAATCICVNEQVVHGIPGPRRIEAGDIVTVDVACRLDGWCADAAWTYPLGEVDPRKARLLAAGRRTLERTVALLGRCRRWSQVARAAAAEVRSAGFSLVEQFAGHGIGREMHEDPQAPSHAGPELRERDFPLQEGLVLAVEPILAAGSPEVGLCEDGWSVETVDGSPSVHFEHTVALTAEGVQVLTAGLGE